MLFKKKKIKLKKTKPACLVNFSVVLLFKHRFGNFPKRLNYETPVYVFVWFLFNFATMFFTFFAETSHTQMQTNNKALKNKGIIQCNSMPTLSQIMTWNCLDIGLQNAFEDYESSYKLNAVTWSDSPPSFQKANFGQQKTKKIAAKFGKNVF